MCTRVWRGNDGGANVCDASSAETDRNDTGSSFVDCIDLRVGGGRYSFQTVSFSPIWSLFSSGSGPEPRAGLPCGVGHWGQCRRRGGVRGTGWCHRAGVAGGVDFPCRARVTEAPPDSPPTDSGQASTHSWANERDGAIQRFPLVCSVEHLNVQPTACPEVEHVERESAEHRQADGDGNPVLTQRPVLTHRDEIAREQDSHGDL